VLSVQDTWNVAGKGVRAQRVQWTAGRKTCLLHCTSELRCVYGIWRSDGGVAEYSACILGEEFLQFGRIVIPPLSWSSSPSSLANKTASRDVIVYFA
jgi:hypothetical protein